jgi:hypothetical protein
MPSRSVRRRQHKQQTRAGNLKGWQRSRSAARLLELWRTEARRRAADLGAPAVWALAESAAVVALADRVDPSGELLIDLRRVCAEAVAEVTNPALAGKGIPVAGRKRREVDSRRNVRWS